MSAASSKLGRPECGSSRDLPGDLRTVLGETLGFTFADIFAGIDITIAVVTGFIRGYNLSDRDIVHKVGCGLYHAASDPDYVDDKHFVYDLNAFMRAGN